MREGGSKEHQKVNSKNKTTKTTTTTKKTKLKGKTKTKARKSNGEKGKSKKKNNFKMEKSNEKEERKMPQNKARLNRTRSGGWVGGGLGLLERKSSPFWGGGAHPELKSWLWGLGMNVMPGKQK